MSLPFSLPVFVVVTAALIGVLSAGRRLFPGTFAARRVFRCPFRETDVSVDFKEAVWDSRLMDVSTCSAFSPPQDVQCEKGCLKLEKFAAAGTASRAA